MPPDVVVGVDLGTTSTKAVAFSADGEALATARRGYAMTSPEPGYAEQDADEVAGAGGDALREVAQQVAASGGTVRAVAFSSAMHGLVGLGADGEPATPLLTWADSRAGEQARRLHGTADGMALHQRTGTPVHAMSPLLKLRWYAEHGRAVADGVRTWCAAKDLLVARLTGRLVTDSSLASGTGMLALATLDWDDDALAYASVGRDALPEVADPRTALPLSGDGAATTGLPEGTPVVLGGGDGPLANLGVGAVRPGMVAISIGTSGAVRGATDAPRLDPNGRVFCYVLVPGRFIVGGAVNNGGIVLDWLADAVTPDLAERAATAGDPPAEAVLEAAAEAPAGSGGLLFLPYLLGERAPRWAGSQRGVYLGLTRDTRRRHLVRAAVEGVCLQLAVVAASLADAGVDPQEIRATGGFARSDLWRRILASALDRPIGFAESTEGSALGAALLGWAAVGELPDLDDAAALVQMADVEEPDKEDAAVYARLRPVFAAAAETLEPIFDDLAAWGAPAVAPG